MVLKTEEVIARLNWFYSLELNQVDFYKAQSRRVEDIYIKKTLERVAAIEQGHVDNISTRIRDLGGEPTRIGEALAPLGGRIAGTITGAAGLRNMLVTNVTLEEKAMKDYKDFILKVGGDENLFEILWSNLIDEDLHAAWFSNKAEELARGH